MKGVQGLTDAGYSTDTFWIQRCPPAIAVHLDLHGVDVDPEISGCKTQPNRYTLVTAWIPQSHFRAFLRFTSLRVLRRFPSCPQCWRSRRLIVNRLECFCAVLRCSFRLRQRQHKMHTAFCQRDIRYWNRSPELPAPELCVITRAIPSSFPVHRAS